MAWKTIEQRRAYARQYAKRPEVAVKRRKYDNGVKARERRQRYRHKPEVHAKRRAEWLSPAYKQASRDFRNTLTGTLQSLLNNARRRAKGKEIPCTITRDYLMSIYPEGGLCPVFGYEMVLRSPCAPSLDEVIRGRGYVPGNVVIMSLRANRIKNDATQQEVEALAKWWRGFAR